MFSRCRQCRECPAVGVKAVFLIGSTNHKEVVVNSIPVAALLPYCDGDAATLSSVAYYDMARYNLPGDPAPKFTFEVMGANRAWYNTAFFRLYLRGATNFLPFLKGDVAPPGSTRGAEIHVGYQPADRPEARLDLNRFTESTNLTTSTLGGDVTASGLSTYTWCDPVDPDEDDLCLHRWSTGRGSTLGRRTRTPTNRRWHDSAWPGLDRPGRVLTRELPGPMRDVIEFRVLQFRAFLDYSDPVNPPSLRRA